MQHAQVRCKNVPTSLCHFQNRLLLINPILKCLNGPVISISMLNKFPTWPKLFFFFEGMVHNSSSLFHLGLD